MIRMIKVPDDRKAVVIGKYGKTRKFIEKKTSTKITVGDEIKVEGEAIDVMTAENIIKAVARGFAPKYAYALLDEEKTISILDLPKNAAALKRIRSRLIGTKGKSRRNIETLTKTIISVYGKTVAIIGYFEDVKLAEDAIDRLISGSSHASVYAYLESHQVKDKISEI